MEGGGRLIGLHPPHLWCRRSAPGPAPGSSIPQAPAAVPRAWRPVERRAPSRDINGESGCVPGFFLRSATPPPRVVGELVVEDMLAAWPSYPRSFIPRQGQCFFVLAFKYQYTSTHFYGIFVIYTSSPRCYPNGIARSNLTGHFRPSGKLAGIREK